MFTQFENLFSKYISKIVREYAKITIKLTDGNEIVIGGQWHQLYEVNYVFSEIKMEIMLSTKDSRWLIIKIIQNESYAQLENNGFRIVYRDNQGSYVRRWLDQIQKYRWFVIDKETNEETFIENQPVPDIVSQFVKECVY
jgi:hypothetical protein